MRTGSFWSVELALFFLLAAGAARAADLEGRVLEKGTRAPLEGVNVYLLPSKEKDTTDEDGAFLFEDVAPGEHTIVVNAPGYDRLEKAETIVAGTEPAPRLLYLRRVSYEVYETTIYDKADRRDDKTRTMGYNTFAKLPGSNGDPIKAVQNLPGVNRANSFSSQVIIEGSAPQDTSYTVDGHRVPLIFHFGGLSSVVFPEALDRVEYLSAGFGPEYGNALGGVVGVWLRPPKRDRYHGLGFADLINTGLLVEGPLGDGGLLLGGRVSYVGFVLKALFKGNSNFDLTTAPEFSDVVGVYDTPLTARDNLRLVTVGSLDTLEFLFTSPVSKSNSGRGTFYMKNAFVRLIPEYTHKYEDGAATRLSLAAGRDWIRTELNDIYLHRTDTSYTLRGEHERKLLDDWTAIFGLDSTYLAAQVDFLAPRNSRIGGGDLQLEPLTQESTTYYATLLGAYLRNVLHREGSPWTVMPNLRIDWFSLLHETVLEPRAAVRYALDTSTTLRMAGGYYAQLPQGQQIDRTVGNPDLKSERAYHATAGVEKDLRGGSERGFVVSGDVFYKYFDNLVVNSSALVTRNGILQPERYNNSGIGRAFGFETLIKMNLKPWTGWLAYTLSRSTRLDDRGDHLFQYDQTHLLTAIAQLELGRNWTLSARLRFTTGNPYTAPVGAVFDSDLDTFRRINGFYFTSRFGPFFSLDARVDKKWVFDNWILSAYLDVQNLTNRENPEQINYSYDYSKSQIVSQLPILPTIGLRGEF